MSMLRGLLLAGALLLPGLAPATGIESLAQVRKAALRQVHEDAPPGTRVVASARPLDPRLRLAACAQPLQTDLAGDGIRGSRVSVAVRCAGPQPWVVRVAVEVHLYRHVLVTTRALARGDHVGAGDLVSREYDVTMLGYGYVSDPTQVAGRALARPVGADTVLTPSMLAHREVVKRGERVMVMAGSGPIQVRAAAEALAAGDGGQRIRVRNLSSGQVVDATVVGPGLVRALP